MGIMRWLRGRGRDDRRIERCQAIIATANTGMAREDAIALNEAREAAWSMLSEVWLDAARGDRDAATVVLGLSHVSILMNGAVGVCEQGGDSDGNRARCVGTAMMLCAVLPGLDVGSDAGLRAALARSFVGYVELTVQAAHHIGLLSAVSAVAESLSSVELDDRMSRRWLADTAEGGRRELVDVVDHVHDLTARMLTSPLGGGPGDTPATVADMDRLLRDEITASVGRIPLDSSATYATSPVDAAAAAATRTGRYLIYLSAGVTRGSAVLVGPDDGRTLESIDLPDLDLTVLRQRLGALRTGVADWRAGHSAPGDFTDVVKACLAWVGRTVWEPVLERWPGLDAEPFSMVPLGETAFLPLFTAPVDGRPVCAGRDLTVAPSARSLILASTRARPGGDTGALILADGNGDGHPLPRVASEAVAVAARYGAVAQVLRHAPGAGATHAASPLNRDDIVGRIRDSTLVHLACHGDLDFGDPLESSLVLGGPLRLRTLLEADLRPGTVIVLSACDLATIDAATPGEQLGFPAVLLASGARSVVAAHWPVPDGRSTTVRFMTSLHDQLACGVAPSRALGRAVGTAHDLGVPAPVWAPFTCYGA